MASTNQEKFYCLQQVRAVRLFVLNVEMYWLAYMYRKVHWGGKHLSEHAQYKDRHHSSREDVGYILNVLSAGVRKEMVDINASGQDCNQVYTRWPEGMSHSGLVALAGSSCRCVNSLLKGQQLSPMEV